MAGRKRALDISGAVWLRRADRLFLGGDRIDLLEMVGRHGSITRAARAAGISYKTAWDVIDAVNNLAEKPLVVRSAGGRGGGGTTLTPHGEEILRRYRIIQEEHRRFLKSLSERTSDPDRLYRFARRIAVKVSARNVFSGTVAKIRKGAVNTEVTIALKGGDAVVAVITNRSVDDLGLRKGTEGYAIIKASSVILGKDLHDARISARNVLCGVVERIAKGPVNADIAVRLPGGNTVSAVITGESLKRLGFRKGDHACAAIKASSVIVGVA